MKIIITSGGTSEPIDSVRKITNNSSGKLGSIIAEKLCEIDNIEKIYYVCSKNAVMPENKKVEIKFVSSVDSLLETLKNLIQSEKIDYVIHSMAVSDYKVHYVTTDQILSEKLQNLTPTKILEELDSQSLKLTSDKKISSNMDNLIIRLIKTPKVISQIKLWDKNTKLIGFKLLVDVSENELINVAYNLLEKNNCDYVLANDLTKINAIEHNALLIDKEKNVIKLKTKNEIAQKIFEIVKGDKI